MNKKCGLLLIVLLMVPGCWPRKRSSSKYESKNHDTMTHVDIPVADESVKSFFDEDLTEFMPVDDSSYAQNGRDAVNEYAWVENTETQAEGFKAIYFDFDKYTIKQTQEENLAYDVNTAKQLLANNPTQKLQAEGHASSDKGSKHYNLVLSENRARTVADSMIQAGVAPENIQVVGRGIAIPAIIDGKIVSGGIEQQWPNRRVELRVIS